MFNDWVRGEGGGEGVEGVEISYIAMQSVNGVELGTDLICCKCVNVIVLVGMILVVLIINHVGRNST